MGNVPTNSELTVQVRRAPAREIETVCRQLSLVMNNLSVCAAAAVRKAEQEGHSGDSEGYVCDVAELLDRKINGDILDQIQELESLAKGLVPEQQQRTAS